MRTFIKTALLASAIACQVGAAQAQECVTFASGEILCDDGLYAYYYYSPASQEWLVLDRDATAAALGLDAGDSSVVSNGIGGSTIYGNDSSLTTTDDGCTMFSSPGYSYGESFSFSSGC
jgi:hypothetical protein